MSVELPLGFHEHVTSVGIKDNTPDFTLVVADEQCHAAGVFTQSRFSGPSVAISRENVADHVARAVVVISKNANVATGLAGMDNAREIVAAIAGALSCKPDDVLIASTGVIGRPYPMDKIRAGIQALPKSLSGTSADAVARGIMTTDTVAKVAQSVVSGSNARVVGVAKGVGMIEPNMATLITLMFTDAAIDSADLDRIFRGVMDRTFNCVSIDTDTSTSDTALILASGKCGAVDLGEFESALFEVALSLTKQVARDGEGAEKLIEVYVDGANSNEQAKTVAKAIVNSPLVKTAIHGADPNWGRVAMAIGKCGQYLDIDQDSVVIRFGTMEVYPTRVDEAALKALSAYMKGAEVRIHVTLNTGSATSTVWGCDLTDGYVRINSDYTT